MGFFSSLFGGGSKAETVSTTNVTVKPETNIVNVLDLEPIQRLVSVLSEADRETAAVQAEGLKFLAVSQERIAAEDRARDSAAGSRQNFLFVLLAGVSALALVRKGA